MISNYLHTIRYLKFKQIYYRILFYFKTTTIDQVTTLNLRNAQNIFCLSIEKKVSLLSEDTFTFLNETKSISKIGWTGNTELVSKLWRYNQHYFDDLNAKGSYNRKEWHYKLLLSWINNNNLGKSIGWDSYPISIRVVNLIKWHFSGNILSENFLFSITLQIRWLYKRIEWHILANHLFSNAKALVFSGLFFRGKEANAWLEKGLEIIHNELKEQILNDGGNFERSPMYHSIFLEDLLDLVNISRVFPNVIKEAEVNKWKDVSVKMLRWLDTMSHPDGEISFFNDATFGVASNFKQLKKYAEKLGIKYVTSKFHKVKHLPYSGYIRLNDKNSCILIDVAPIGPDYQPGHAHADTLTFEMSLFKQRVIVNSGVSEYGLSSIREYERSTKAHNTLVINDENSSEVWKGFRVARRAYPFDLKIEEADNIISINCSHDGYKRFFLRSIHKRHWQYFDRSLMIQDKIEGSFKNAYAFFHFHPSVKILKKQNNVWNIKLSNRRNILLEVKKGKCQIEEGYFSPEFGKRLKNKCLKVSLDRNEGSLVQVSW